MVTNQEILSTSLSKVKAIEAFIKKIYEGNLKNFSGNKILLQSFTSFFNIAASTIKRLENPVLSIAMVGTTSAGKSTIVNGLVGRRVAPMEPKEMSAGILTLTDSMRKSITVHPTTNSRWPTGTTTDLLDEEICRQIRYVYEKYHGNEAKVSAPIIDVTGPIEWQQNRSILGLPSNLNIEFIDLPGLKTVNDRKNFEVIQKILSKAFCIVAMDFTDVDPTRIQRLLEEVKDVVKAANNNTEFLLFVLNKIDNVKSNQTTANEKIIELKGLIKETLALDKQMEILPFVGQLYYLIQMAVIKDNKTFEIVGFYPEKIQDIFTDCSNFFRQAFRNQTLSKEEYSLIRKIEDCLVLENELLLSDIKNFYSICSRISEANSLFKEIKRRINESFAHIVIRPTLDGFNKALVKLLGDLDVYISINKNSSIIDLISDRVGILRSKIFIEGCYDKELSSQFTSEAEGILATVSAIEDNTTDEDTIFVISRIKKDMRKILTTIEQGQKGYIDQEIDVINSQINEISDKLGKLKSPSEIISYLQSQKNNRVISVFNGMTDIPATVKKNLVSLYLDEFRISITSKKKVGEFIEKMSPKMPTGLLKEFSMPYEKLYELFYSTLDTFTKYTDEYRKTTKSAYSEQWKKHVIDTLKQADRRVRNVLSKLTGLAFQRETNILIESIQKYLDLELNNMLSALSENAKIQSGDISILLKNALDVSKAPISLPEELFTFSSPYSSDNKEVKYAGSKIVGYRHKSCSSDEPIYESVYEDEYTYKFDNEVGCYNRWVRGIGSAEMIFWNIINEWLKEQVTNYMNTIKEKAKEVTAMVDSFLDMRHKELESKQENRMAILEILSEEVLSVRKHQVELNNCND